MLLTFVVACFSDPAPAPPDPAPLAANAPPFAPDDPESCRVCHTAVVEEWTQSMHANAHHDNDPIHGRIRAMRIEREGAELAGKCAQCHEPRSVDDVEAPAAKVGVSCSACHLVDEVHLERGPGAKAFVYGETMRGSLGVGEGASPVHPTGPAAPHFVDGQTLCLACHDATQNPAGVAACTTGPEHRGADEAASCVSCHMPRLDGPSGPISTRDSHASHRFHGPHDAWKGDPSFLADGLELAVSWRDGGVDVTLTNLADHGFPSGFPGRMAYVAARGLGAGGDVVWTSGPPTPETLMNKVYVDDDGKPVPPFVASALKADRRLEADETRTFRFEIPDEVVTVEASVVFRLLPPPMAQTIGLADAPEGQPRTLATVKASR